MFDEIFFYLYSYICRIIIFYFILFKHIFGLYTNQ